MHVNTWGCHQGTRHTLHNYADDTQLSPGDTRPIDVLYKCILEIKVWMAGNFLKLNQDKTKVLVISPEAKRENNLSKLPLDQVKNLGGFLDPELTFISHIKHVVKTVFF